MNHSVSPALFVRRLRLWGAAGLALAWAHSAHAFSFSKGELKGSFDTTLSAGTLYRLGDPSPYLYGTTNAFDGVAGLQNSVNADDGDLNYGRGTASTLIKANHELELRYRNFGAFVRGYYFYDFENVDGTRDRAPLSSEAINRVGRNGELLDAYVLAKFDVAERPVDLRIGRQVLSLGESTFIPNGINVVNPVDLSKLRLPGAELKEAFLPVNMLKASISLTENITVEPFWLLEFRQNEIEPAGTYFSTNDFASPGGRNVFLGFGALPDTGTLGAMPRGHDREGGDLDQFGLATRVTAPGLHDTEFGFYYARYHSRSPVLSAHSPASPVSATLVQTTAQALATERLAPAMIAAGYPAAGVKQALATLLGAALTGVPSANLPASLQPFYPAAQSIATNAKKVGLLTAGATGYYYVEYPEAIDMLGVSFNTTIGQTGIAWQGEVSYKHDVPLQADDVELLFANLAVLNDTFGGTNNQLVGSSMLGAYGTDIAGYRRHDVWTAQTTLTKSFGPHFGAQQVILVGEIGGLYADIPNKSILRYEAPGTYTSGDANAMLTTGNGAFAATPVSAFADNFSCGYQIVARAEYNDVFAGVNLTPSIAFSHDISGTTPLPLGNFVAGRKSMTLALEFLYQNSWSLELRYANYFGGDRYNLLSDRDYASATVKYSF